MKRIAAAMAVAFAVFVSGALWAGQIGFEEEFALAKDRSQILKTLIPGTEEYYFYTCLSLQQAGSLDEVDKTLKLWIEAHNRTTLVTEIENRQALLKYEKDPQGTMQYLQRKLGLTFSHERQVPGQKPALATALDPATVSQDAFFRRALVNQPQTVNGFEDSGIERFIRLDMTPDQRRSVLQRITRPDYPNLPQRIADDLAYRYSGGFGSMPIHGRLLLAQMDELLKLKPDLLNQGQFANAYLLRLQPGADVDMAHDKDAREAYLDRVWAFVSRLDPAHNSLKAGVLYNRLTHDLALGKYDLDRFMEYIKLPRNVGYMNNDYLKAARERAQVADINANFGAVVRIIPIHADEPLVREYLSHFFLTMDSTKSFEPYIRDDYLKQLFAETKLVNGIGDPTQWYSMLQGERVKPLMERIDLNFAPTNKAFFALDEPVKLDLWVKNVPKLIVKVFEINTLNFYRDKGVEIGADINLDGLVANEEQVFTYTDPPIRRIKRELPPFASLNKRGVFIIEFIGNGQSSRALIRKGQLRMLTRTSAAGQVFTILDESNRKVPTATLWFGGREYAPDKEGVITLPFSNAPANQAVILRSGDFATLTHFQQEAENYALTAGLYVDRESLIKRGKTGPNKAAVVVRPALTLNGVPVSLKLLEQITLTISSMDADGVSTSKEIPDFKLFEDRESSYEFQVPESCVRLSFQLKAKVQNLSLNQKQDLAASQQYVLNGIDATEKTEDLHLRKADGKYTLDVLGKTGEDLADRAVAFQIKHTDFKDVFNVSLKSDAAGAITLGDLAGIQWIRATSDQGVSHQWVILKDIHSYPQSIDAAQGDAISIPYMGKAVQPDAEEMSLLEVRAGTFVADQFSRLAIKDGFLTITGLEPGDYDLLLKADHAAIKLRVTKGAKMDDYILGENRQLQVANAAPLQILAVESDKDNVRIRLANATPFARVHVIADRFMPEYSLPDELGKVRFPDPAWIVLAKPDSFYVEGRDIGDEYRYILERKYAVKFPGNMLARPGLLLNPWAIRKTETGLQGAIAGDEYGEGGGGGQSFAGKGMAAGMRGLKRADEAVSSNLDFLSSPAMLFLNQRPDAQGVITIPRKDLGPHAQIHVLACDPINTAYREASLSDVPMEYLNLVLDKEGLDPAKHFTERKEISVVKAGEKFVMADASSGKLEVYDTVAKVYALYATLSNDTTLEEFSFILNWPKLKDAEKQEKYSKYACHELNIFLMRKDPAFFTKVVQPYLRNKKDKTFVDQYLIQADVSAYMKPWEHAQLNVVERALLAERIANEKTATARHITDLYDLLPPDVERFNMLFKTALKAGALEANGPKYAEEMEKLTTDKKSPAKPYAPGRFGRSGTAGSGAALFADASSNRAPAVTPAPAPAMAKESMDRLALANNEASAAKSKSELRMLTEHEAQEGLIKAEGYYDSDGKDMSRRENARQFYRKLQATEELAENNYYHRLIEDQNANLVTVNAFWRDFAKRDAGDFLSTNVAESSRGFTDMMLALAETDLPFEAKEHAHAIDGLSLTLTAASPFIIYHKEIKETSAAPDGSILVGQNFFADADRYVFVNNERQDKYLSDEFLVGVVYGCKVVITNTSSAPQKLDVLLQIPRGSMPLKNGFRTRSVNVDLAPYNTTTVEYFFYFPATGKYAHYPVHVAKNEKIVASSSAATLNVVAEPSQVDTASWDYLSQNGAPEQVVEYLKSRNINRVDLARIAWRMKNADFFRQTLPILAARHVYNDVLWSYGIRHNDAGAAREFLTHQDGFVAQCGLWLESKLLSIDPVVRKSYQHLEYSPLVNARAHRLGKKNVIVNDRFFEQYERLMKVLAYRPKLDDDDMMTVTYYMLLQDRVEDGMGWFAQVKREKLSTQIQYDYLRCYLDFYTDTHAIARGIAADPKYAAYPVDRWRNLFANVVAQLDEAEGKAPKIVDKENREQQQAELAATETSFDFKVEAKQIVIDYQNVTQARINYYLMDVELLFSRSPFVQEYSGQFAFIRPNETAVVALPAGLKKTTVPLPAKFHSSNVMIEIEAGGVKKSQACFSNSLTAQLVENYGLVYVASDAGKPLPKTYVKVFARMNSGAVRFYKDGYTDLRGCFDYASLSTGEIDQVERFSILIMSETAGAVVKEASPPKR